MDNWTECRARMASAAGVTRDDIAQIAFGYGLFTGGFGLHYGLERVGASVLPISSGNSERQLMFMQAGSEVDRSRRYAFLCPSSD